MNVLTIISTIRNSFDGSVDIYTNGSCYRFYEILKAIYPQAEAWYDSDHVITKIMDKFYDITGEVNKENHIPIENYDITKIKQLHAKVISYTTNYA